MVISFSQLPTFSKQGLGETQAHTKMRLPKDINYSLIMAQFYLLMQLHDKVYAITLHQKNESQAGWHEHYDLAQHSDKNVQKLDIGVTLITKEIRGSIPTTEAIQIIKRCNFECML